MPGGCKRCGGTGRVVYQHGPLGTDRHAKYSEVEWGPKTEKDCPVCLATGWGKPERKQRPERGSIVLHAPERALQAALDNLREGEPT